MEKLTHILNPLFQTSKEARLVFNQGGGEESESYDAPEEEKPPKESDRKMEYKAAQEARAQIARGREQIETPALEIYKKLQGLETQTHTPNFTEAIAVMKAELASFLQEMNSMETTDKQLLLWSERLDSIIGKIPSNEDIEADMQFGFVKEDGKYFLTKDGEKITVGFARKPFDEVSVIKGKLAQVRRGEIWFKITKEGGVRAEKINGQWKYRTPSRMARDAYTDAQR